MTEYRIICTNQEPISLPHNDAHIVAVGTEATTGQPARRWTVQETYQAMDRGDRFFTTSPSTKARAQVIKWSCRSCRRPTLKSTPDAVLDNNLDHLPRCG